MISIQDLTIGYSSDKILYQDLCFCLNKSNILAIIGQNGAGKSTLLKTIAGIVKPISGIIKYESVILNTLPVRERSKIVAYLSQNQPDLPPFNTFEFVSLGLYPYLGLWGKIKKPDLELLSEIFSQCQIEAIIQKRVDQLSSGEQQKVLIAKALAQKTPVILLDEPTTFLDLKAQIEFAKLIRNLATYQEKHIIMVAHDLKLVREIADYVLLLGNHQHWLYGPTNEVLDPEYLEPAFGLEHNTLNHFIKE